ncbi:MAG: ABC transporter permease [Firmicutes bacterium]|jgi:spermidine/putrescine transport system permease protein|nr:ABC transporter permease [Bacillota bacterium]
MAVFPQLRRQRSKREEPIGEIPGGQRHRAILLMPGMIWLVIFSILPLALVVVYSFASRGTYGGIEFKWTLENYARLADRLYLAILWRSFLFAFATTVLCLVLGYPMAYAIASSPEPRKNRLLLLIVVPFWTNFLIRTYAWIIILRGQGLINGLLMHLGLISEPLRMLYTPGAVLLGFVYNWLPFMILPLYASLEKIDRSYIEAAMDLGAQGRYVLTKVILPLSLPGIAAGCVLVFIPALAMFAIPDLLGGARTMLVGNLIKNQFLSARNWPFGSAASVFLIVAMLLALFIYRHVLQRAQGHG